MKTKDSQGTNRRASKGGSTACAIIAQRQHELIEYANALAFVTRFELRTLIAKKLAKKRKTLSSDELNRQAMMLTTGGCRVYRWALPMPKKMTRRERIALARGLGDWPSGSPQAEYARIQSYAPRSRAESQFVEDRRSSRITQMLHKADEQAGIKRRMDRVRAKKAAPAGTREASARAKEKQVIIKDNAAELLKLEVFSTLGRFVQRVAELQSNWFSSEASDDLYSTRNLYRILGPLFRARKKV